MIRILQISKNYCQYEKKNVFYNMNYDAGY